MVQLLRALDFGRYTQRIYILSQGDHLSASKANELELSNTTVSACCQPMHAPLIVVAGGPPSESEDNNHPTCSRSTPATINHSVQCFEVFRVLSDRIFGQTGAPGRTAGGFVAAQWTRNVCSGSRSSLFRSSSSGFPRVSGSKAKLTRSSDSSLVCLHRG